MNTGRLTITHWNILDIISFSENGVADFGDREAIGLALNHIGQIEHPDPVAIGEMVSAGLIKRVSKDKYKMTRLGKEVNES